MAAMLLLDALWDAIETRLRVRYEQRGYSRGAPVLGKKCPLDLRGSPIDE